MNAVVAKRDADPWPGWVTDERQELPSFWTFSLNGHGRYSAFRGPTALIGGQTRRLWLVHAPRLALTTLRDTEGMYVRTLKEAMTSVAADDVAARLAWRFWLVDGTYTHPTLGPIAVTSYPWVFSGTAALGVDGLMNVAVLVRPRTGQEVCGNPEDYNGAEATL